MTRFGARRNEKLCKLPSLRTDFGADADAAADADAVNENTARVMTRAVFS